MGILSGVGWFLVWLVDRFCLCRGCRLLVRETGSQGCWPWGTALADPGASNSSLVGGAGFLGLWLQGPQDAGAGDGLLVAGVVPDTAGCGVQPVLRHIDAGPDPAVAD